MSAAVNRKTYEKTKDVSRMLTSGQLAKAIINAVKRQKAGQEPETNIFDVVPARAATSMRYDKGATTAMIWNESGNEERIDLPLKDGWRRSDGNPFGVPNGEPSSRDDPEALYLYRLQDGSFNGPVGLGDDGSGDGRGRSFDAYYDWSGDPGVALVNREAIAPLVKVPKEKLVDVADPKALLQRAGVLETAANELTERLGGILTSEAYDRLIKPTLEEAAFLRELAGKIQSIQKA